MQQFLRKNFIPTVITALGGLILLGALISYYNRQAMQSALLTSRQSDMIMRETENLYQNIRSMDISVRGYALMHEDSFLFLSPRNAHTTNQRNCRVLDSLLAVQGYQDPVAYQSPQKGLVEYANMYGEMVALLKENRMDEFKALLAQDKGNSFWQDYDRFARQLMAFENKLNHEAQLEYEAAELRNTIIQILLVVLGLPAIGLLLYRLRRDDRSRRALLLKLEENNQKYLFDAGTDHHHDDARDILENSIENLKKAADFVTQISEGNYEVDWQGLNEQNQALNDHNLVGKLIRMRELMKQTRLEDERRIWSTEGLARFSEVVRNHQHDLPALAYQSLVFLSKYLQAQQASLFIAQDLDSPNPYLQLSACYAFDRKKYLDKRIQIGQGLLGQTYLEAQTVVLTQLPQGYTFITSGLGDATPGCLIIVPMKYNEQVQALLEIASFQPYLPHQVAFLEKAGEFVASAIASAQNNHKTQQLLEQFQQQTEQLRSQEEELRQNMEELEATQEEMRRKEKELEARLAQLK